MFYFNSFNFYKNGEDKQKIKNVKGIRLNVVPIFFLSKLKLLYVFNDKFCFVRLGEIARILNFETSEI